MAVLGLGLSRGYTLTDSREIDNGEVLASLLLCVPTAIMSGPAKVRHVPHWSAILRSMGDLRVSCSVSQPQMPATGQQLLVLAQLQGLDPVDDWSAPHGRATSLNMLSVLDMV